MIRRLCFGLVFLFVFTTMAHAEMVSIKQAKARMRSGPGEKYPIKWELGIGYPLQVVSRKGSWLKVTDYESDTGWIYKTLVGKTPYMIVEKEKTIIRKGPSESERIIGNATRGVVLRTMTHKKGWVKVKHESGLTGWVQRETLWGW
ncbi:SH3 domain-containing protein [Thiovibrio frasassiensis]|jgi:SH3-like domain-containing protein|uniref:SH3 domain-containing protein n=1 Tax=Thiovibrio frasassiensis TaxID=2984131 RepID=A0A9X4MFQ6_9BACT|nr:SH3 domain-containing protein [Thiovibrio frasassiensis]MDG4475812.1 SH3 domain-containing protein [Thiovibrio frasassiensis]